MDTRQNEIFKAMADPNRRKILGELCRQSREAGELARMVGMAPNAVSFHLRALKAADLVTVKREGRFLRYSLESESVRSWRHQVESLFPANLLRPESVAPMQKAPAVHSREVEASAVEAEMPAREEQLPTELL